MLELKGLLCRENIKIENEQETCLQIGTYVGLILSFLDSNYSNDNIWIVTLGDKTLSRQVIKKLM